MGMQMRRLTSANSSLATFFTLLSLCLIHFFSLPQQQQAKLSMLAYGHSDSDAVFYSNASTILHGRMPLFPIHILQNQVCSNVTFLSFVSDHGVCHTNSSMDGLLSPGSLVHLQNPSHVSLVPYKGRLLTTLTIILLMVSYIMFLNRSMWHQEEPLNLDPIYRGPSDPIHQEEPQNLDPICHLEEPLNPDPDNVCHEEAPHEDESLNQDPKIVCHEEEPLNRGPKIVCHEEEPHEEEPLNRDARFNVAQPSPRLSSSIPTDTLKWSSLSLRRYRGSWIYVPEEKEIRESPLRAPPKHLHKSTQRFKSTKRSRSTRRRDGGSLRRFWRRLSIPVNELK